MALTNKHGLPDFFVRAVEQQQARYTRGRSDVSVTQLIAPAYQRRLMETAERIEDVSQRIKSFIGTAVHRDLEEVAGPNEVVEERFFFDVAGRVVSGQADRITEINGVRWLIDYKVTKVWSYILGEKVEWEQQLNLLRFLASQRAAETGDSRYLVSRLGIFAIFKDFVEQKAGVDGYPPSEALLIEVPVWTLKKAADYLYDRVEAHFADQPQPCTDEERWATPETYAVMKKGRKAAVKLFNEREPAEEMAKDKGPDHHVSLRPKTFRRCESYCSVAHACSHHNSNEGGAF